MSFEGYEQLICKNGHYRIFDVYFVSETCDCGAPWAMINIVDETNGTSDGIIPRDTLDSWIIKPAIEKTCPHCGHTKQVSEAIYRIPSEEERQSSRVYVD